MVCREGVGNRPEVAFEPIACCAAIDQVIGVVIAAGRSRLKMIDFELATRFRLADTTVAATSAVTMANRLAAFVLIHRDIYRFTSPLPKRALVFGP